MLTRLRLVIAGFIVVLTSGVVSYVVSAGVPDSLRPVGATRYAVVSATDQVSMQSLSYVDVPNLSLSITIPSGKRGDVLVFYCGQNGATASDQLLYLRALIAGRTGTPSQAILQDTVEVVLTRCANFYRLNVGEGTKTVKMQWAVFDDTAVQYLTRRSMIVIVNIHN